MGHFRIHLDKNAGILEDYPTINTGENEVAELWYGNYGISRFLFRFNYADYITEFTAGRVPHFSAATVNINLFNCSPIFEDEDLAIGTRRATSTVIVCNKVDTDWDEGIGHDYTGLETEAGFACWYSAKTATEWTSSGGDYSTEIKRISLDKGNENFSGSVSGTDLLWAQATGTNYGFILRFEDAYEVLSGENKTITKFFTRHTNTAFQPYLDVQWDNQITDQSGEIYPGTTKKLYLQTKKNGTFANVNSVSAVTIAFSNSGLTHTGFVASAITNPIPGFYCISFDCPTGATEGTIVSGTWYTQYESGMTHSAITMVYTAHSLSSAWDQSGDIDPIVYWLSIPDLQDEYVAGSRLYLDVNARVPYTNTETILKTLEYKIDIDSSGNDLEPYIDWEGVSYTTDSNFVSIDTSWFETGYTYYLKFRYSTDGNYIYDYDKRTFKVVS